ncbi:MAG: hypothetical protein L0Z49_03465 [Actinobacteria bacterium]|nr:hypothetical protein [Actinomycetota bacterium]
MAGLVVLTRNLMDAERIRLAVPDAGVARTLDDPGLDTADLILLDLGTGFSPAEVVAIGPPVIAYGPHVDTEALQAAITAGCRDAYPRSRLFQRLPTLL